MNKCDWEQEDDGGPWATDCGEDSVITDGPPSQSGMKFCCFCGKPLTEKPFVYSEEDDD